MQPVRLLMQLQRQPQMQASLVQPYLNKLAAKTTTTSSSPFPSLSSIHHSAQGSIPYSFSRPAQRVFLVNPVPSHKFSPVLSSLQSQEIFTHSASLSRHGIGRDAGDDVADNPVSDSAWVLRLANENGFLSWCRNCYLSTAVGVGMEAEGSNIASFAYQAVFLVAGLNLTLGTSIYIFNILKLRHQIGLSTIGTAGCVGGAFTHYLFWLFGLFTYVSYILIDANHPEAKKKQNASIKAGGGL